MTDKIREEFEAWAISHEYSVERYDDGYLFHYTDEAWAAWKASRAALCVELPVSIYEECEDQIGAFEAGACMTAMQLDDTGVNVKNKPDWYDAQVAEYKNKPLS